MSGLWLSWLGLALAPALYWLAGKRPRIARAIDVVVLVALAALLLVVVLPDLVRSSGWWAFVPAAIGFAGPGLVEWRSHRIGHGAHLFALTMAMVGLAVHALIDGVALHPEHADGHHHGHVHHDHAHGAGISGLGWAVVLHRLPVALAVWTLLSREVGRRVAVAGLLVVGFATTAGWVVGPSLLEGLSERGVHVFEAFVAGSLLHVVVHRPHAH